MRQISFIILGVCILSCSQGKPQYGDHGTLGGRASRFRSGAFRQPDSEIPRAPQGNNKGYERPSKGYQPPPPPPPPPPTTTTRRPCPLERIVKTTTNRPPCFTTPAPTPAPCPHAQTTTQSPCARAQATTTAPCPYANRRPTVGYRVRSSRARFTAAPAPQDAGTNKGYNVPPPCPNAATTTTQSPCARAAAAQARRNQRGRSSRMLGDDSSLPVATPNNRDREVYAPPAGGANRMQHYNSFQQSGVGNRDVEVFASPDYVSDQSEQQRQPSSDYYYASLPQHLNLNPDNDAVIPTSDTADHDTPHIPSVDESYYNGNTVTSRPPPTAASTENTNYHIYYYNQQSNNQDDEKIPEATTRAPSSNGVASWFNF